MAVKQPQPTEAASPPKRLWEAALPRLRSEIGERNFREWIAPLEVVERGEALALSAPNATISASVNRHFVSLIAKVLTRLSGRPCSVRVSVRQDEEPPADHGLPSPARRSYAEATFGSFVVGESNRDAYAHALAVAQGRFTGPSPLVVFGGVGLGKTHLAGAIANAIQADASSQRAVCEPCADFVDRLLAAVRGERTDSPEAEIAQAAVLILDDIHFLAGQASTQEALLRLFAILHDQGTPVVLTSDRAPQQIPDIERRLRSRFEGGILASIVPPEFDLRRRILLQKSRDRGVELSNDVATLLAERVVGSVRALEGTLTRACAHAVGKGQDITAPLRITRAIAARALRTVETPRSPTTPEIVRAVVSEARGLPSRALASRRRTRDVTIARQLAMYLCRKYTRLPLTEIAHRLGRRDHSTVLHACEVVDAKRTADPTFDAMVNRLEELLQARAR